MALYQLFIIATILIIANTLTDEEKKEQARVVVDKRFHSLGTVRRRWKQDDTALGDYRRFECRQIYCSGTEQDPAEICWHISIHIHHETQKQFDRIYLYEYGGTTNDNGEAFMGTTQRINQAEFNTNHEPYDIVGTEIRFNNQQLSTTNGRPTDCHTFCYIYKPPITDDTKTIIIQAASNKLSVRVDPDDEISMEPKGSLGEWAQWEANTYDVASGTGGFFKEIRLKNIKTGKWARLENNGDNIEVTGGTGTADKARFKILNVKDGEEIWTKFESKQYPGKYIEVSSDGNSIIVGSGVSNNAMFRMYTSDAPPVAQQTPPEQPVTAGQPLVESQPLVASQPLPAGQPNN